MASPYLDRLADMGFMVVLRRNRLGTTTMFAVRQSDIPIEDGWDISYRTGSPVLSLDSLLKGLPEWRVVDISDGDAERGAVVLYEKLTCTGKYATWDARMARLGVGKEQMLGFEHRPESERFEPVD